MSIGSRIKLRREELGLTQPELAKLVGVSKGSIGNYESEISSPNENILIKLFSALDCDANYLYYDDISRTSDTLSSAELNYIKKYRTLDTYGQKAVSALLDIEYERCTTVENTTVHTARIAAYGGGTKDIPAANVTKEELEQLEALQRGLNEAAEIDKKLRK